MNKEKIIEIGLSKLNLDFSNNVDCVSFCRLIYREAGYELNFDEQPYIESSDIFESQFVGNILFLKHKKYGKEKRYTHIGIILPDSELLHYSRNFNTERKREVLITSFVEIFKVYDIVQKPVLKE